MTFRPSPPVLRGSARDIRGYGSSLIIAESHITVVSDRWLSKVGQALGSDVIMNYGVGGSKLMAGSTPIQGWSQCWMHQADRLPTTAGQTTNDIRPPSQPAIFLMHGINDAGTYAASANLQVTFRGALEANTRMLRAGFAFRNTDGRFVYTGGTWTADPSNNSRGGTSQAHNASNGTATWTSNSSGFLGGNMCFYATVRPDNGEVWKCTPSVNGVAQAAVDVTANYGVSGIQVVVPIPVANVPAGNGQVVSLAFTSVGAGGFYFQGGTLESQWPPLVFLCGQPILPTMPPATYPLLTTAILDGINASHVYVSRLFNDGKARYVDLTSMNAVGAYWQDDLHYSPSGHARIAELVVGAVVGAGGIPPGYSAGPVLNFTGVPDWSGDPGATMYDPAAKTLYAFDSITAADTSNVVLT